MLASPRPRGGLVLLSLVLGFAAFSVPFGLGLFLSGEAENRHHASMDLRELLYLLDALLSYAGCLLALPFTRRLRLGGPVDAMIWGAMLAAGGGFGSVRASGRRERSARHRIEPGAWRPCSRRSG